MKKKCPVSNTNILFLILSNLIKCCFKNKNISFTIQLIVNRKKIIKVNGNFFILIESLLIKVKKYKHASTKYF